MSWFDLPKAFRSALLGESAISDAVGTRLHYQEIPQSSDYPHIWFTRSNRDRTRLLDGSEEMTIERFTFEVVSNTDAEAVVDAIVNTLEAFEDSNVNGLDVQLVEVEDVDDDYEFQSIGEGEPLYLHALQVAVYAVEQ